MCERARSPPSQMVDRAGGERVEGQRYAAAMKKLLLLVVLAGVGYLVYRQIMANKAEQDLWSEATAEPDLR